MEEPGLAVVCWIPHLLDWQLNSAKIYRDKTTHLTKQVGFFFIFVLALNLSPIDFVHKTVGIFLYRCYFVTNSKYAG